MQPYVFIPLIACVAASGLASAVVARDPNSRQNWLMAALLGCNAVWALLDGMWNLAPDAESALALMRLAGVAYLPMGPLGLHLLAALRPDLAPRLLGPLRVAYTSTAVLVLAHVTTSWFISGVVSTDWGRVYQFGDAFLLGLLHTGGWLGFACVSLGRAEAGERLAELGARTEIGLSIVSALAIVIVSDILLPRFGIHGPRVGSLSLTLLAGGVWWWTRGTSSLTTNAFARQVLDELPDGVALLRDDGRVRAVNRSLADLVGVAPEDLAGRPAEMWVGESMESLWKEGRELEITLRLSDGSAIAARASSSVLRDWQGGSIGIVLAVRDQREVVELRRQLVTSARLAAVGELAAGIAHEVNNPIAFIQANLNELRRHYDELSTKLAPSGKVIERTLDDGRILIDQSLGGVRRVASVVRQVRGFSHSGAGETRLFDVNELLESVLRLALLQLGSRVSVDRSYGEVAPVRGAGQELKQAFLTLILNAADSLDGAGTLRLETAQREGFAVVAVVDDGLGMSAETLDRIFDPVLTAENAEPGQGLRLSVCYEIVRRHGGELWVDSSSGGTRVEVKLPLGDSDETGESTDPERTESGERC